MAGIDDYTVLMLHCDGSAAATDFPDSSYAGGHTITANGTAQVDTGTVKFGTGSALLQAAGSAYLSAADSDDWDFEDGDFTVDFQLNLLNLLATRTLIGQWEGGGSPTTRAWHIDWLSTNTLRFGYSADGVNEVTVDRSWTPTAGTYAHVEIGRASGQLYVFIDGVQQGAVASVTSTFNPSPRVLSIGALNGGAQFMNGYMDEIRISKGICRHTANFTPPTAAYTYAGPPVIWEFNESLDEWTDATGTGGFFDSAPATETIVTSPSRTGYSMKATVDSSVPDANVAVRAFAPWVFTRTFQELYFGAWYYFPEQFTLTGNPATGGFWNIQQIKGVDSTHNDPIFSIILADDGDGGLYPRMHWGNNSLAGPHSGDPVSLKIYEPNVQTSIELNTWTFIEMYLLQSNTYTGAFKWWQNGVEQYSLTNVVTAYVNAAENSWGCDNQWSANNYNDGTSPAPCSIYIANASMSTEYIEYVPSASTSFRAATRNTVSLTSATRNSLVLTAATRRSI